VWHRTSSSLGWDSPLKVYLMARNQLYLRKRHTRGGARALRGLAYAAYVGARTWARFMRGRQRKQARALELAWWDYARGRVGDSRTPELGLNPGRPSSSRPFSLTAVGEGGQGDEGQSCLICGATRASHQFTVNGYHVYRCAACGFAFVAPTPAAEELADYYARGYAVPLERYAAAAERNEERIADLERWAPGRGRLLEIGASYGHSLALARARGWQVEGVELSPEAARYARERFGLDVHNADLGAAPLPAGAFDAAMLWHVLEHTRDPKEQLERLRALLRPGGVLGLRVPNAASLGSRVAGRWWPWMCPPAHLWYFSPETLPRLLRVCGFEVLEVQTLRGDGNNIYQHALLGLGGWLNGLRRGSGPLPLAPFPKPGEGQQEVVAASPAGLVRTWIWLLARAQPITDALARLTRPAIEPIERGGLGDELLVYARKPAQEESEP
jgi:SAM-dependent methyltransferase